MIDKPLFGATVFLLLIGLLLSYSLSTYTVVQHGFTDSHFFTRQLVAVIVGIFFMTIISKLDPDRWFRTIGILLFVVFLTILLMMPLLSENYVRTIGGAKRWIDFRVISISL